MLVWMQVPIVASTGGLVDTVKEGYNGFQMGAFSVEVSRLFFVFVCWHLDQTFVLPICELHFVGCFDEIYHFYLPMILDIKPLAC